MKITKQIKINAQKDLVHYFACKREVIQTSLNSNSSKLREFVKAFGTQLSIFYYLVLVRSI